MIDIVDGPLSKEEFDLISQAMWDPTTIVLGDEDDKAKFEKIAKNVVRWRYVLTISDQAIACRVNLLLVCVSVFETACLNPTRLGLCCRHQGFAESGTGS